MRVIVTRPEAQAAALAAALRERGFVPVLCPLIDTVPIEDGPIDVDGYDWIVVTSANGATQLGRRRRGLVPELPRPAGRVLFVGAEGTGELLESELDAEVRAVYRTRERVPDSPPAGELVLLASGSAARAWAKLGLDLPAISIGPQTTAAAIGAGVEIVSEARTPDVQGLVDCAAAWRDSLRS